MALALLLRTASLALVASVSASPLLHRPNSTSTVAGNITDVANTTAVGTGNGGDGNGTASGGTDLTVVKFAVLAESLEATFYDTALKKFTAQDFTDAGFVDGEIVFEQLTVIQTDEATHLSTLQSVAKSLGGDTSDVDSCSFDFSAAMVDVGTFLQTARVLEFVGIDAYIGGATLISDKSLLVSAAEILTVEARHNSGLNTFNSGSSIANAFDMVLSPQQVLSIAGPFVSGGCDPATALGLTPTPALSVTNNGTVVPGTLLSFGGAGLTNVDTSNLFCHMIIGGATEAITFPLSKCVVPDKIDGAVHLFVCSSSTPLSANIINQDTSIIVAGPAVAFIDTVTNLESELLLGKLGNSGNNNENGNGNDGNDGNDGNNGNNGNDGNGNNGNGNNNNGNNNNGNNNSGQTVSVQQIIIIEQIREEIGVKTPVDGGIGGAVALGWL
ncbi:hypothetical protein JCM24511_01566 [Saitozyma sp. JCM 24511]|nr:hypothetical protein JCM24511_01566 [Saitozyma sp. JCM 24511]